MKPRPAKVTVNHAWKAKWLACGYTASGDQLECLEEHWNYNTARTKGLISSRWYYCRQCPFVFEVPER